MARQHIYGLVVAVVVSTTVGFAMATISRPDAASAGAYTASSNAQIVSQLRKLNRSVGHIDRDLGAIYKRSSLTGVTYKGFNDVYEAIVKTCNALNPDIGGCPSFVH